MQVKRITDLIKGYGYPAMKLSTGQEIHLILKRTIYKIIYKNKKYELHKGKCVLNDNLTYKELTQLLVNILEGK